MDGVADIRLILEDALDLCNCPGIPLFLRGVSIDIGKRPIALIIQPTGCGNLLLRQCPCDFSRARTVKGQRIDSADDSACFLIDHQLILYLRVLFVSERGISANPFSCLKFRRE